MDAPTADELLRVPQVLDAIEQAWADSLPGDPARRHEEGGWVYLNPDTGEYLVLRSLPGIKGSINIRTPHLMTGYYVVARFHTHPNPAAAGWVCGPSDTDQDQDRLDGLPGFVRAEDGIHHSGPDARRGGMAGPWGNPEPEVDL